MPGGAEQQLAAAAVDVPVVAASWLKGNVCRIHLPRGKWFEIALPDKILCVCVIFVTKRENLLKFICVYKNLLSAFHADSLFPCDWEAFWMGSQSRPRWM
jgi:hypothetical protein